MKLWKACILLAATAIVFSCGNPNGNNPRLYTVSYEGNGYTAGTPPADSNVYSEGENVTVLPNSGNLECTDYCFAGWNTADDGSGTNYLPGDTFTMGNENVTLYAYWSNFPVVTISTPVDGSKVAGTVNFNAAAEAGNGIEKVEFYVNGTKIDEDSSSPYEISWDTNTAPEDSISTLKAVAYDIAGNSASDEISVTVDNTEVWHQVGTQGFTDFEVRYLTLHVDDEGTPYVAYRNNDDTIPTDYSGYVMGYDGSVWEVLGGGNFSDNAELDSDRPGLSMSSGNGTIYVAYSDPNSSQKVTVKFLGSDNSWDVLGSAGFSENAASYTDLFMGESDDVLYAAVEQPTSHPERLEIWEYDFTEPSPAWNQIGPTYEGDAGASIQLYVDETGADPSPMVITYGNGNLQVHTYDGSWTTGTSTVGSYYNAYAYDGTFYAIYDRLDPASNHLPYVSTWDGSTWSDLGCDTSLIGGAEDDPLHPYIGYISDPTNPPSGEYDFHTSGNYARIFRTSDTLIAGHPASGNFYLYRYIPGSDTWENISSDHTEKVGNHDICIHNGRIYHSYRTDDAGDWKASVEVIY